MKYIGIDLGDGESAVAQTTESGAVLPTMMLLGEDYSILSLVGMTKDEKIVVGENVLLDPRVTWRRSRFKSRFLRDPSASEDIQRFATGMRNLLGDRLDGTEYIALGCPAGWSEGDREHYTEIMENAGFKGVRLISESRGAFMYAFHSNELSLTAEQLTEPVLVIDIGSSTTDFAHIVERREIPMKLPGHVSLGGGLLDKYLLEDAVEQNNRKDELKEIFRKYESWRSKCEIDCRRAKENWFTNEKNGITTPSVRLSKVFFDVQNPIMLRIQVDQDAINRVLNRRIPELNDQSFLEALEMMLSGVRDTTLDHPPTTVILTGGASRMIFFQEACRKAFPDAMMAICNEPEYSIARGLSIAARTDHQLVDFRQAMEQYYKSDKLPEAIKANLLALQKALTPVVLKPAMTCISTVLQESDFKLNARTQERIRQEINAALAEEENAEAISTVIARWAQAHLKDVQTDLENLCTHYGVHPADIQLARPDIAWPIKKLHFKRFALFIARFASMFTSLIIPFIARVFSLTPQRNDDLVSAMLNNTVRNQIQAEMLKPNGDFSKQLIASMTEQLRELINEQASKVELLLN